MWKTVLLLALSLPLWAQLGSLEEALSHPDRSEADRKRDERSKPAELIAFAGVKQGDVIADIFAGAGYYSEILGRVVGSEGRVICQNNNAWLAYLGEDKVRKRFSEVANVAFLKSEATDLNLPEGGVDIIWMVMTYHDLYHTSDGWPEIDSADFMKQLFKALKPGGKVIVVDHDAAKDRAELDAQKLHRIEKSFARKDFESAGFTFVKEGDFLSNSADDKSKTVFDPTTRGKTDRFVLLFTKPAS